MINSQPTPRRGIYVGRFELLTSNNNLDRIQSVAVGCHRYWLGRVMSHSREMVEMVQRPGSQFPVITSDGPVRPQRRVVEAADNSCDGNVLTSCRADKLTPTTTSCLPLEWRESYVGVDSSILGRITVYFHNGDNVTVFKSNSQIRILSVLNIFISVL